MEIFIVWSGGNKSGGEFYMNMIYQAMLKNNFKITKLKVNNFNFSKVIYLIKSSLKENRNYFIFETRSPKMILYSLILKVFGYKNIGIHQEKHWINARNLLSKVGLKLFFILAKYFSYFIVTNSLLMQRSFFKENSIVINPGCDRFKKVKSKILKRQNYLYYFGDSSKRKGFKLIKDLINNNLFKKSNLKIIVTNQKVNKLLKSVKCNLRQNINVGNIPSNSIILVPSLFEGYGMVIAESLYRGDVFVAASDRITDELKEKCDLQIFSNHYTVEKRFKILEKYSLLKNFKEDKICKLKNWSDMQKEFVTFFLSLEKK